MEVRLGVAGAESLRRRVQRVIPRTIEGLLGAIAEVDENVEFVVKFSYIEIQNEKLLGLLGRAASKSWLEIKEDKYKGIFIQNCTEISVGPCKQIIMTMDYGSSNRKVAFAGMNEPSSRSHFMFVIYISQKNLKNDSTKQSKLYVVDLAGSDNVSETGLQGVQLEEANNINKSLSSLGNVLNALASGKKEHIVYCDSKLTRLLQESLSGNSRTTLIINCSIGSYNAQEILSTLRFGNRAKNIKGKAKVDEEKSAVSPSRDRLQDQGLLAPSSRLGTASLGMLSSEQRGRPMLMHPEERDGGGRTGNIFVRPRPPSA